MPQCPICSREGDIEFIEQHVDTCTGPETSRSSSQVQISSLLTGRRPSSANTASRSNTSAGTGEIIDLDSDDSGKDTKRRKVVPSQKEDKPVLGPTDETVDVGLLRQQAKIPLAERLRPKSLAEYVGQSHLVGPGGILRGFIEHDRIPSMILWGPPGVGKTSIARIISQVTKSRFVELSATSSGMAECRKCFEDAKNELRLTKRRTILFCDEIHRFNKSQQDVFLPYVERGDIVLVGATTENPSFQLNSALLSRCRVFTLNKLKPEELNRVILKALLMINRVRKYVNAQPMLRLTRESVEYLSDIADGDSRSALNLLDLTDSHYANGDDPSAGDLKSIEVDVETLRSILKRTHMVYDRVGDAHYDTISAFHKSIRGSDPDAAMFYLGRMLKGGESPLYIARRMIRIASEDVGVLDDSCLPFAIATYQAVQFVGLPEADMALVHCAVKLARAKKSVQIYRAWGKLNQMLDNEPAVASSPIPLHLRNAPTKLMKDLDYGKSYKYNPDFLDGKVKQEYLPEALRGYEFIEEAHLGWRPDTDL
ncbi:unnamed protein product [Kuraishia capsulata CBS 1993]|uniref:AAA+ ATPase domain-containing protein n=1 Tax=Kuraishia capsulata CBS 1993 TaxID=1382522 RepID=W6MQB7_9ASCO|nr:uncharacterized protein KUCA_T00004925001 [Kuraishia capsulata CBS 1993]CDK28939.1 unnamed protein product [Kuraishia capsulata CBS 1993]